MIPAPPKEWPGTEDEWVAFASSIGFAADGRSAVDEGVLPVPQPAAQKGVTPLSQKVGFAWLGIAPVVPWIAIGLVGWWFLRRD